MSALARAERALLIAAFERAPEPILRLRAAVFGEECSKKGASAVFSSLLHMCRFCGDPAVHGEGGKSYWCAEHTPWSGHYEFCGAGCEQTCCGDDS